MKVYATLRLVDEVDVVVVVEGEDDDGDDDDLFMVRMTTGTVTAMATMASPRMQMRMILVVLHDEEDDVAAWPGALPPAPPPDVSVEARAIMFPSSMLETGATCDNLIAYACG